MVNTSEVVLLMGHGTRDAEGVGHFVHLHRAICAAAVGRRVEAGFLEFGGSPIPFIHDVIDRCVDEGIQRILTVPILLHDAGHSNHDMPAQVDGARARHPALDVEMAEALGINPSLLQILEERIADVDTCLGMRAPQDTSILLVGRGTTNDSANGDFFKVGRLLWERNRFGLVECAFVSLTEPSVPMGVERCARLGAKRLIVVPYFLHTGVLVKRIADQARDTATRFPDLQLGLADPMGVHPNLVRLILDRITGRCR